MIYVPSDDTYNKCFVVQSEGVLRAYDRVPSANSNVAYRDYFISNGYIYKDGQQTFSAYSTIPVCLSDSVISNNVFYRLDIDKILVCFFILVIIMFYFPYRIISRVFGRWLKI